MGAYGYFWNYTVLRGLKSVVQVVPDTSFQGEGTGVIIRVVIFNFQYQYFNPWMYDDDRQHFHGCQRDQF